MIHDAVRNARTVKISTALRLPSVRRLAINIVRMLLVLLVRKENLLALY